MKTTKRRTPAVAVALAAALVAGLPLAAAATPAEKPTGKSAEAVWHTGLDAALAAAAAGDRYLLVDLYADWCVWCKRMDAQVFSTAGFADFAADYVLLRVDVEDGGEGSWLQDRLGARSLPTLAILGPDLALVGKVPGFQQQPLLELAVGRHVSAYERQRAEVDAALAGDDPQDHLEAADKLRRLQAGRAAADAYRKAVASGSWSDEERLRIALATADALRLARDYEAAGGELARARGLLAAAELDDAERADASGLLDYAALRLAEELEECQQLAALESFVHDRRSSPLLGQAKDRLDHLKQEAFGCS